MLLLLLMQSLLNLKGGGGHGASLDGREDALLVEPDTAGAGPCPVAFHLEGGVEEGGREGGREGVRGKGQDICIEARGGTMGLKMMIARERREHE